MLYGCNEAVTLDRNAQCVRAHSATRSTFDSIRQRNVKRLIMKHVGSAFSFKLQITSNTLRSGLLLAWELYIYL